MLPCIFIALKISVVYVTQSITQGLEYSIVSPISPSHDLVINISRASTTYLHRAVLMDGGNLTKSDKRMLEKIV